MTKEGTLAQREAKKSLASRLKGADADEGLGAFKAWLVGELGQAQCEDLEVAASVLEARMRIVALVAGDLRAQSYAQSAKQSA